MSAGNYTWRISQGAQEQRVFTYLTKGGGASVDLTDMSAKMQVRPYKGSPEALVTLDSEGVGGIVLGGELGTVEVTISSLQTAGLTSDGYYDIQLIDADEEVDRFVEGAIKLSLQVTE